jgi:hypothetical protein
MPNEPIDQRHTWHDGIHERPPLGISPIDFRDTMYERTLARQALGMLEGGRKWSCETGTHWNGKGSPQFGGAWDETMERMPYRWLLVTNICAYDDTQPSVNIMIIECVTKTITSLLRQIT